MSELNPRKLNVTFRTGKSTGDFALPRRYTLTHSDFTGDLYLTIGNDYDHAQISGLYTRLMRDEVLAEWQQGTQYSLHVYCHVRGGFVFGTPRWRYGIFKYHMPMVLQAFRYGDQAHFDQNPELDGSEIWIHFQAKQAHLNKTEFWGTFAKYNLE
jgi:hypothetical protein